MVKNFNVTSLLWFLLLIFVGGAISSVLQAHMSGEEPSGVSDRRVKVIHNYKHLSKDDLGSPTSVMPPKVVPKGDAPKSAKGDDVIDISKGAKGDVVEASGNSDDEWEAELEAIEKEKVQLNRQLMKAKKRQEVEEVRAQLNAVLKASVPVPSAPVPVAVPAAVPVVVPAAVPMEKVTSTPLAGVTSAPPCFKVPASKPVSTSASLKPAHASAYNLDQLSQMTNMSAMVDDKLRAFGAAGLTYSCPDLQAAAGSDVTDLDLPSWGKWGLKTKSGRDAKQVDNVVKTLKWPHSQLDFGSFCTFDKIDFPLLVAGELSIIASDISSEERSGRVELLQAVAYHAKLYKWSAVRDFFASVLQSVERGQKAWGTREDYRFFESSTLYRFPLTLDEQNLTKQSSSRLNKSVDFKSDKAKRFFCFQYQTNQCSHQSSHDGVLPGRSKSAVRLEHFCRACYNSKGSVEAHAEIDKCCPSATR